MGIIRVTYKFYNDIRFHMKSYVMKKCLYAKNIHMSPFLTNALLTVTQNKNQFAYAIPTFPTAVRFF